MHRFTGICLTAILLSACGGGGGTAGGGKTFPDAAALVKAPNDAANWVLPGQNYMGNRLTPLTQINASNVSQLRKAWITPLADDGEQEAAPIIWNGVMYISTAHDHVLALDAATGAVKWGHFYSPQYVILYAVNRGVGLSDGKVYIGTQDCRVLALDANNGNELWNIQGCDTNNSWYSMASYVYGGHVLLGTAGGDTGNMGLVQAFDTSNGKNVWNWNTVPHPGEPNFGTWPGNSWQHGGAAVWAGLAIDPISNTLYVGPGNAGPNLTLVGRKGKDLYSDSVVALDISGAAPKLKWYYQILENDTHDSDPAMPPVLFDGIAHGKKRMLLAIGDKDGNFVILDRTKGSVVYRIVVSEQKGIMLLPTTEGTFACPNHGGGVEWNGGSYDPRTNYFLIPSTNECAIWKVITAGPVAYVPRQPYSAGPLPKRRNATGVVTAIDVGTGKVAWRKAFPYAAQGGVTITATGIAFTSDTRGRVYALDPRTGNELWHDDTGSSIVAPISTYLIGTRPYLAVVAGEAGNQHTPNLPPTQGSRVVAYSLGVTQTAMNTTAGQPTPKPMASEKTESGQLPSTNVSAPYTPAQVAQGKALYMQSCSSCHGATLEGVSAPALTGASFGRSNLSISQTRTIVTTQMPLNAPGSLKPAQYAAIMAYMLSYDCVSPSGGGKTPSPTSDMPQFRTAKLSGATCPVK
jgi:alcohol dehydrogenase (cytochrome c)